MYSQRHHEWLVLVGHCSKCLHQQTPHAQAHSRQPVTAQYTAHTLPCPVSLSDMHGLRGPRVRVCMCLCLCVCISYLVYASVRLWHPHNVLLAHYDRQRRVAMQRGHQHGRQVHLVVMPPVREVLQAGSGQGPGWGPQPTLNHGVITWRTTSTQNTHTYTHTHTPVGAHRPHTFLHTHFFRE